MSEGWRTVRYPGPPSPGSRLTERSACLWRPLARGTTRTGGGKAAITGDFVLTADEVNPVLRALRSSRIEVTTVHNHMLDDVFFMHFWGNDDPQKLAKGLRAALDRSEVGKAP